MRAIYAFSGDPITYGHIDIVKRAARTYDEVVVAIGENPEKTEQYLFSTPERLVLTKRCLAKLPNVECVTFSGLLGEYAYRNGFDVIVRGVRNNSDLEGELVQFAVNESQHLIVDTVFFPTRRELSHISSGIVKAIVREGGDVSAYCPLPVKEELEKRILGKYSIGIAGGIATGKSYIAERLVQALSATITATYVSLDDVGHHILGTTEEHIFVHTRRRIAERFGTHLLYDDGAIDRKLLGKIVFANPSALAELNEIMREPMLARLYEEARSLPVGVMVLEGAILVEAQWTNLVNNNILLIDAPEEIRFQRLMQRSGIAEPEARLKIRRQITSQERSAIMEKRIDDADWGRLWKLTTANRKPDLSELATTIADIAMQKEVVE